MARRKGFRFPIAVAAVVVLIGAGVAYAAVRPHDDPRYRAVAATRSDVEQTLSSSGLVDAAARADLGFGTQGTVAKIKVALGEKVKPGQVLAVLDTTDLDAAVTRAESTLATAEAQLAADREAQTAAVAQAVDPAQGAAATPPTTSSGGGSGSAGQLKELTKYQDAVIESQGAASKALAAATMALAIQAETCANANVAEPSAEPSAEPTAEASAEPAAEPSTVAQQACGVALAEVADRQDQVGVAQEALAQALTDLAGALTKALGSTSGTAAPVGSSAGPPASAKAVAGTPSVPTSSGGASSTKASTVTAARLASDQANIEQARADLIAAQQQRGQARLRSTRSGRVVALDAERGDVIAAGTPLVTVMGGVAVTVTGTATETQLSQLEIGQTVRVTVPGSAAVAQGRLTAIGLVADSSSGTASYPFTVTVQDPSIALPTGSQALLQVVVSTATDVVTVPISAVERSGNTAVVRVIDGAEVARRAVTLGAVGTRTVEVVRGLEAGDRVVLAAMDEPIKGADTELANRGGFGGPGQGQFRPPGGVRGGASR